MKLWPGPGAAIESPQRLDRSGLLQYNCGLSCYLSPEHADFVMKQTNPIRLKESWILCFLLGVVMLNFPFLEIFNKPDFLFGIPILVLYLMIGWPLSILVIYLFTRFLDDGPEPPSAEPKDRE